MYLKSFVNFFRNIPQDYIVRPISSPTAFHNTTSEKLLKPAQRILSHLKPEFIPIILTNCSKNTTNTLNKLDENENDETSKLLDVLNANKILNCKQIISEIEESCAKNKLIDRRKDTFTSHNNNIKKNNAKFLQTIKNVNNSLINQNIVTQQHSRNFIFWKSSSNEDINKRTDGKKKGFFAKRITKTDVLIEEDSLFADSENLAKYSAKKVDNEYFPMDILNENEEVLTKRSDSNEEVVINEEAIMDEEIEREQFYAFNAHETEGDHADIDQKEVYGYLKDHNQKLFDTVMSNNNRYFSNYSENKTQRTYPKFTEYLKRKRPLTYMELFCQKDYPYDALSGKMFNKSQKREFTTNCASQYKCDIQCDRCPSKPNEHDPSKDPCKRDDPLEVKFDDPCKKQEDPSKKNMKDPCKKNEDPCKKKEDPCKKKDDPCKKKEDPCKKKEDPCKKKEDPCKKKEDPCKKKEDPCKKKEDPCKKKEDPCKKKEDPCKKKEDPCKKKDDPCKKKEDPSKKTCLGKYYQIQDYTTELNEQIDGDLLEKMNSPSMLKYLPFMPVVKQNNKTNVRD